MKKSILFLFLCVSHLIINAQDTTNLKEIIITATRGNEKTPITEKTYSGCELKDVSVGQEMSHFLGHTPGAIYYTDGGSSYGYSYWRMRGLDQTRINFTLDGIPMSDAEDQGFYSSNFPDLLNGLGSIQIQRGVGSSTYGTSSYAGSVNMWSPRPISDSTYGSASMLFGSFKTMRQSAEVFHDNNGFYAYLRFSNISSDNFRNNSGISGQTGFLVLGKRMKKHDIKLVAFSGGSESQMAYLASHEDSISINRKHNPLSKDERDDFEQNFISLSWQYDMKDWYLTNKSYANYIKGNYDLLLSPDMLVFALNSKSYGHILNLSHRGKIDLDLGLHYNTFSREHSCGLRPNWKDFMYQNVGSKQDISAYLKTHKRYKNLLVYTDAQIRSVSFLYKKADISLDARNFLFFNPKAGLNYSFKNSNLYAVYGRTHREPTRNDMFAGYDDVDPITNVDFVGFGVDTLNINTVKPETVNDFELGYKFKKDKMSITLDVYHMIFKNEIVAIGRLSYIGLPLRKNVENSVRSGVEVSGEYKTKNIIFYADLTYQRAKIEKYMSDLDFLTYTNITPLLSPNIISNQTITLKYKFLDFTISGRFVSESYLDNTQNENFKLPSNYTLSTNIKLTHKNNTISVRVDNLTNQKYYLSGYSDGISKFYYVGASRSFFFSYVRTF